MLQKEQLLKKYLAKGAQALVKKHNPHTIGITGSIGKTSATQAVAHVLSDEYRLRVTSKNYNNEYGLPLTIIGAESGGSSLAGWIRVFFVWAKAMFSSNYPEILVLEYGIDRPGDMKYLTSIVPPHIGVLTCVSKVHIEFFEDINHIAREKGVLIESIISSQHNAKHPCAALLNIDDKLVMKQERRTKKAVYTYGYDENADFRASHVSMTHGDVSGGLTFKIEVGDRSVPVRLPYVVGSHSINAILVAISITQILKLNLVDIVKKLSEYKTPPGRMRLLQGRNDTILLDDTYNASLKSMQGAIESLAEFSSHRTIAIVGDMLELGEYELKSHKKVGTILSAQKTNIVICVGKRMLAASESLQKNGYLLGESLFLADTPDEAIEVVDKLLREGDIVLVKGSQGMRMEKISEFLLADHLDPYKELCRQSVSWKKKSFNSP